MEQHGKIVDISVLKNKKSVNAHPNCQCEYVPMRTKRVGTATDWGMEGADAYLHHFGRLPDYYVDKQTAQQAGWQTTSKKLSSVLPGKCLAAIFMLTMTINCRLLPEESGMRRILIMAEASEIVKELYIQTMA